MRSAGIFDDFLTAGLLTQAESGTVVANVSIYPCSGFHFVTDHHYKPITHDYHEAPKQPVMHLGEDSYTLAHLLPQPPKGGTVLDLCTGSGVQAIMHARRSKLIIGVDINPRAVEFAHLVPGAAPDRVLHRQDQAVSAGLLALREAVKELPGLPEFRQRTRLVTLKCQHYLDRATFYDRSSAYTQWARGLLN